MRISDWSSDVCSSDLPVLRDDPSYTVPHTLLGKAGLRTRLSTTCATACWPRSEEHTSELQSLMRISYAVFCLKKYKTTPHCSQLRRAALGRAGQTERDSCRPRDDNKRKRSTSRNTDS